MKEVREPSFLVFSDDWGEHPSSCQHIFKHIAKDYPVLWVNTVGMRSPRLTWYDTRKALIKGGKMLFGTKQSVNRTPKELKLRVYQPPMVPFPKLPGSRTINKNIVVTGVKRYLAKMCYEQLVLVTTVPNACDYIGCFGEEKAVYYCVDDFTEWPGFEHDLVRKMEEELIAKCDRFVATSSILYDRLKKTGKPTTLLTHGVDVEMFSNLPEKEHPLLRDIPKPRVGYYGLFDERTDQELLLKLAYALTDVSFVITGKVESCLEALKDAQNIFFTGSVSYENIPLVAKGFDICMLPYKINDLTTAVSPLKLKEYIATGKPVICTPIREAQKFSEYIWTAQGVTEWVRNIRKILRNKNENIRGVCNADIIRNESWENKTRIFLSSVLSNANS